MSTLLSSPQSSESSATEVLATVLQRKPKTCPFIRWHLQEKFRAMEKLFRKYLTPGARFIDMACGTGDALALAALCQPEAELWGLDIYPPDLEVARTRTNAVLVEGNMLDPQITMGSFDIVHEFGAAYLIPRWDMLAKTYFSLLRDEGILLWELPQKWSLAHISYLLSVAPKITAQDTKFKRVYRSFFPSKYTFRSDLNVTEALQATGCNYEILEKIPISHFYCRGLVCKLMDYSWKFGGDGLFAWVDKATGKLWPRYAGYYLVIRKNGRSPE
jgi:trans-aconitate methyltransferase